MPSPTDYASSKDLRLEADMQVRRWERALGTAIREGQERGEIKAKGGDYASCDVQDIAAKPSPSDFASKTELSNPRGTGIYALTDNATPEQFEDALTEAREDGNVSRASRAAPSLTWCPCREQRCSGT